MDATTLQTVGQIAGIGGIALGVLLLLFREVIRKNIFPNLTKNHAYQIIRLIVVTTFLIAALGIGAWTYVQVSVPTSSIDGAPVGDREKQVANTFWDAAYAGDWRIAYDVFPDVLHSQMAFPNFINASKRALGQFSAPPVSRDFESANSVSGTALVTGLARFDDVSVFREQLTFQRQNGRWVPWSFVVNPVQWPQANEFVFLSATAGEIVAAANGTPEATRESSVQERFVGKFIRDPGWTLRVDGVGAKAAARTCDVRTTDEGKEVQVLLLKVLDGCALPPNTIVQSIGRIAAVSDGTVSVESVRFWK